MMKARMLASESERDVVEWARRQKEKVSARLLAAWWVLAGTMMVLGLLVLAGCKCCK